MSVIFRTIESADSLRNVLTVLGVHYKATEVQWRKQRQWQFEVNVSPPEAEALVDLADGGAA